MPRISLSMLLYQVSVLVRLSLANVIGQSAAMLVAYFLGACILSVICRRLGLRSIPNISLSKYNCSLLFRMLLSHPFW